MATRQYIGARYVIKVYENSQTAGSAEWETNTSYEPLTMVTYQNSSYLSKKAVPASVGNPASNGDYWAVTGAYNGQIAQLQSDIQTLTNLQKTIIVTPEMFGAVGDGVTDDLQAFMDALSEHVPVVLKNNTTYLVSDSIILESGAYIIGNNATIKKVANTNNPIIQNYGRDNNSRDDNITITSLNFIGSGNSETTDQGSAITMYMVDNLVIDNIKTNNTNGDGLLIRDSTASISNVIVGDYGRNGVSLDSGHITCDNIVVEGVALPGANPGIPIDCESVNGEKAYIDFTNCKMGRLSIADFYTASGDFCTDVNINNCEIGGDDAYMPVSIVSTANLTGHVIIGKNNKIKGHGTLIRIKNVNGVDIDCTNLSVDSSGGNTVGIKSESNLSNLILRNFKHLTLASADVYSEYDLSDSSFINCSDLKVVYSSHYFNNNKLISTTFNSITCNGASNGNIIDMNSSINSYGNLDQTLQNYLVGDAFRVIDASTLSSSYATITGGIMKIGKVVICNINLVVTSTISANDKIVEGLPKALGPSRLPIISSMGQLYDSYVDIPGDVYSLSAIVNGSRIYLNGTYITRD